MIVESLSLKRSKRYYSETSKETSRNKNERESSKHERVVEVEFLVCWLIHPDSDPLRHPQVQEKRNHSRYEYKRESEAATGVVGEGRHISAAQSFGGALLFNQVHILLLFLLLLSLSFLLFFFCALRWLLFSLPSFYFLGNQSKIIVLRGEISKRTEELLTPILEK